MSEPMTLNEALVIIDDLKTQRDGRIDKIGAALVSALEDNEHLRAQLGQARREANIDRFSRAWGLTRTEAYILDILFQCGGRTAQKWAIHDTIYNGSDAREIKIIDVFVCKLRKKLGDGLIGTKWSEGYYLTEDGMAACRAVVEPEAVAA